MSDEPDDSLRLIQQIIELEEQLDIDIPDDAAERITTVAEALAYLKRLREPPHDRP